MGQRWQKYKKFDYGVVNAIEPSEIPVEAFNKSQGMYFKENWWRKIPGLVETHSTALGTTPVWGLYKMHQIVPDSKIILAYCGANVYKFNPGPNTWTSILSSLSSNSQFEFLERPPYVYFGSAYDLWRRYDGGAKTYSVGENNGNGSTAPRKFSKIVFSPYSARFFGIGWLDNPDYLMFSESIDGKEGIEKWLDGSVQIIESVNGDTPRNVEIAEQIIHIFNQNSIHSGSVSGVPQNWSFQKERSQTGTVAGRTVKKYGNSYFMFTPDFEVYRWPEDIFVTKGRVKFSVNPYTAHLACAEIVDNRYYYLCFQHGMATSDDNYHLWIYDILGDKWYGPHVRFNVVTMFYDKDARTLLCGGGGVSGQAGDLNGFVLEHRGRNIKNRILPIHMVGSFSDWGEPRIDKRYTHLYMKTKQEGSLPGGSGPLEVIVNTDNLYNNPQSQRFLLEDPANMNPSNTGDVREAVTRRLHIHDRYGRGNAIQVELKHEVQNGNFEFSEFDIGYYLRTKKEARRA